MKSNTNSNLRITFFLTSLYIFLVFLQDIASYRFVILFILVFTCIYLFSQIKWYLVSSKFILIFLSFFIFITIDMMNSYLANKELVIPEIISLYFSMLMFFVMYLVLKNKYTILLQSINIILFVSTTFFFLQLLIYKVSGIYIDPIGYITGVPARNYFESGSLNFIRATGLTMEPGNYGTYTMVLLYASYLLHRKLKWLYIYVLISLLLTFSIFSIIFITGFLIILLKKRIKRNYIATFMIGLLAFSLMYLFFSDYVLYRFFSDNEDGSLRIKLYAIYYIYDADWFRIFMGSGFAHNDCNCLIADSSMFFSMFYTFGFISIIIFIIYFYMIRFDSDAIILSIFLLLSKILLFFPIFWVYLLSVIISRRNKN